MINILHLTSGPGPADSFGPRARAPLPDPGPRPQPLEADATRAQRPDEQVQPDGAAQPALDCP